MQWYPIKVTYHVRAYAFGERLIPERLHKTDVPDGRVSETWEISDHRDAPATITNGELAGRPFHEVVQEFPDELVGTGWTGPHFPILEKFLDASHALPVHLHADDETAVRLHGEPHGKTEAWHILWCAPGASILAGIKPGFTQDDLRAAFRAEDYDAVMPRHPIQPGDTIYVPGGILHAFGPDTLIFEAQQTSDLGQSVMPTDLYGNRLSEAEWNANISATLTELRTHTLPRPNAGLPRRDGNAGNTYIVGCAGPYFALERWTLHEPHHEPAHPSRFITLSNVGGPVEVSYPGGIEPLQAAESCIIPAALTDVAVTPLGDAPASLVVCYVPDLKRDIVEPLRAAGHSRDAIVSLGQLNSALQ